MALSELQKKKVTAIFNLLDASKDGILEASDFEQSGKKAAEMQGLSAGSADYNKVVSAYQGLWDGYIKPTDADGDNQVTLEEYLRSVEPFISPTGASSALTLNKAFFNAIDLDGSGQIDAKEYGVFLKAIGGSSENATTVFSHLDTDGSGAISGDEFAKAMYDYFASNDENAPANWFFGGSF